MPIQRPTRVKIRPPAKFQILFRVRLMPASDIASAARLTRARQGFPVADATVNRCDQQAQLKRTEMETKVGGSLRKYCRRQQESFVQSRRVGSPRQSRDDDALRKDYR